MYSPISALRLPCTNNLHQLQFHSFTLGHIQEMLSPLRMKNPQFTSNFACAPAPTTSTNCAFASLPRGHYSQHCDGYNEPETALEARYDHHCEESYYDSYNKSDYYEEELYAKPEHAACSSCMPLYDEPFYRQPQRQRFTPRWRAP